MNPPALITSSKIPAQWAKAVDAERVPQAILLTGPQGSELLPLALGLITYLQCTSKPKVSSDESQNHLSVCGTCESCKAMAKLVHPDVHFTFPVVGTGKTSADVLPKWREEVLTNPYIAQSAWLRAQTNDNKQGNINRDEVMRILHDVNLQRFTNGYKVVMIWGAEYLGDESNRLLKLIEEPPPRTIIFLLTNRFERILPTISSRCRIYRLPYPSTTSIATLLKAHGADDTTADDIAYASGGNISQALSALHDQIDTNAPSLTTWLRQCFAGKGAPIIKTAKSLSELTREQQKHFLTKALRFVRELGVANAGNPMPLRLSKADREVANKLANITDWSQLTALSEELNKLLAAVERNANSKIAFTASSIRIHHILAPPNTLRRAN